jgi:type VI secretion system protein
MAHAAMALFVEELPPMQGEGLLEMLTGAYLDGTPVEGVPRQARRIRSVADQIQRILETRKGMLVHMPDFGMSDIGDLFRRLPGSASEIRSEMETLIRRFEPRMEHVRVEFEEFDPAFARVKFRISGSLIGIGRVQFQSSFFPNGRGEVRPTG